MPANWEGRRPVSVQHDRRLDATCVLCCRFEPYKPTMAVVRQAGLIVPILMSLQF